ncbi:hypothetical protein [Riemerella columbipharyngis]|uniref:Uncharacterized protein n=1 Tax=Riemerella columbipharyngis TaxID=1071918 RepID=A0A1G7EIV4_9FLAO|nr:hypothetical protein [Riemerella columbipharyngis]SDE63609.1 hypothetical protein SAMN05421544_11613 [Riemerella columbipharyngis]
MTLQEYRKAVEELKAPQELDAFDRAKWYTAEIEKLQSELSSEDLKQVLEEERRWADKMQSTVS